MKRKDTLKILDSIKIESPCTESWEEMTGDDRRRHCEICNHSVESISEMTRAEAAKLVEKKGENRLCLRYRVTPFGDIIFKPETSPLTFVWQRVSLLVATIMTIFGLSSPLSAECNNESNTESTSQKERTMLGRMPVREATPTPTDKPRARMGKVTIIQADETLKSEHEEKKK